MSKMIDNMLFLARAEHADHAIERKNCWLQTNSGAWRSISKVSPTSATSASSGVVTAACGPIRCCCAARSPICWRMPCVTQIRNGDLDRGGAKADGTTLYVENRGPTIEPHHLERLFDRFYRADASRHRSSESSGLGLSIVRSIMILHGGTWHASSNASVTRFTLAFPRQGDREQVRASTETGRSSSDRVRPNPVIRRRHSRRRTRRDAPIKTATSNSRIAGSRRPLTSATRSWRARGAGARFSPFSGRSWGIDNRSTQVHACDSRSGPVRRLHADVKTKRAKLSATKRTSHQRTLPESRSSRAYVSSPPPASSQKAA